MKQRPLVTVASIGLVTVGACSIDQDFGQPVPSPVQVPVAEAGTEVPADELVLSPPLLGPDYVHAMGGAHDGNGYLVVWHGQRGLVAARVATSGEVIDAVPFVLAPPTVAASLGVDPPRVFPRRGGGFRVLWNDLAPSGAFHHVTVDADGAAGRPITLPPLVAPVHASQRLTSMVALDASGDTFRAVVEHGEQAVVTNVAIGGVASACAAVVSLPGLVAGTTTFARAGERNLVGAIVQTPAGLAAVVAELSMPAQCATAPGLDTASEVVPSVEILRVPFAAATLSAMMTRPLELVTVDAGAVAVWADIVPKPIDAPIAISAALIPSRGGTAGTPLPLRSGLLRRHGGLGLGIAAHGDEVIVPFVGLLHGEPWWGYRLAAGSMTPTAIPGGATLAARGGPLFAIPGPHNDLLIGTGGGPWAYDSERPAAVAMLTRLTGDGPSPVAWPASSQLRSYVEANTPGVPPWEQDALPGSLASPRHARVSCDGLVCGSLWEDHGPGLVGRRATRTVPNVRATPTLFREVLPSIDFRITTGHGLSVLGFVDGCSVRTQLVGESAGTNETVPLDCPHEYTNSVPRFDMLADEQGFLGSLMDQRRIALFRLSREGNFVSARSAVDSRSVYADRNRLVRAAGRVVALVQTTSPTPRSYVRAIDPVALDAGPLLSLPDEVPATAEIVGASDRARLVWLERDPLRPSFRIRALDVDGEARVVAAPFTLVDETGIGQELRAASDGDGVALVFAHQAFEGEPPRLVLRRFDRDGRPVGTRRELARDLPTRRKDSFDGPPHGNAVLDTAIAPAGPNRWFVAYTRQVVGLLDVAELVGRYVTEPPPPTTSPK